METLEKEIEKRNEDEIARNRIAQDRLERADKLQERLFQSETESERFGNDDSKQRSRKACVATGR